MSWKKVHPHQNLKKLPNPNLLQSQSSAHKPSLTKEISRMKTEIGVKARTFVPMKKILRTPMVMRAQSQNQKSQPTAQQTTLMLETSRMQMVLGAQAMTTVVPMTTGQEKMPLEKTVKAMQLKCLPRPTANSFSTTFRHTDTPMAVSQDLSYLKCTQITTLSRASPR